MPVAAILAKVLSVVNRAQLEVLHPCRDIPRAAAAAVASAAGARGAGAGCPGPGVRVRCGRGEREEGKRRGMGDLLARRLNLGRLGGLGVVVVGRHFAV